MSGNSSSASQTKTPHKQGNADLSEAKRSKNDEFYTQYEDIEKELNAYLEYNPKVFEGKTVLLPCDDPEWSNFTKYFAQRFETLKLKKLISTSYAPGSSNAAPTLFEMESPQYDADKTAARGKIFTLTRDTNNDGRIDYEDLEWDYLNGDGDFRSDEVTALRDEADIIITNPPFSLFREFLTWIMDADKQFLILGNMNAITYKEVFPLIQADLLWLGATHFNTGMYFQVPTDFVYAATYKFDRERDGVPVARVPGICWFTNLEHGRRHEPLSLMSEADNLRFGPKVVQEAGYRTYDNYDAIEVPQVIAIPADYDGVMGVPVTFLGKYCPEQFEILGATQRGCHDAFPDTKKYDDYREMRQNGTPTGSSGGKTNENANLAVNDGQKNYFINDEGHIVQSCYQRIFIRHRRAS
jgi:hypothetical protein